MEYVRIFGINCERKWSLLLGFECLKSMFGMRWENYKVKFKNLVIFSKQNCKYCTLAKELVKNLNLGYNEIFLDNEF